MTLDIEWRDGEMKDAVLRFKKDVRVKVGGEGTVVSAAAGEELRI
jgi:hypothetical protein